MNDGVHIELLGTFVNPNAIGHPHKKPRKPGDVGYHRGALVALGALYAWDGIGVAYREVLGMFDVKELVHVAKREGQMKFSGLSEYMRTRSEEI